MERVDEVEEDSALFEELAYATGIDSSDEASDASYGPTLPTFSLPIRQSSPIQFSSNGSCESSDNEAVGDSADEG